MRPAWPLLTGAGGGTTLRGGGSGSASRFTSAGGETARGVAIAIAIECMGRVAVAWMASSRAGGIRPIRGS